MFPKSSGFEDKQLTGCVFARSDGAVEEIWTIPAFPRVQKHSCFGPDIRPQIAVRSAKPMRDLRCSQAAGLAESDRRCTGCGGPIVDRCLQMPFMIVEERRRSKLLGDVDQQHAPPRS
jgi:hypothetical protein